jgi:hypothetical protein
MVIYRFDGHNMLRPGKTPNTRIDAALTFIGFKLLKKTAVLRYLLAEIGWKGARRCAP